jgi:hypothetical protein
MKKICFLTLLVIIISIESAFSAASAFNIDGILSPGEWDSYQWFTDNSYIPGGQGGAIPAFTGYKYFNEDDLFLAFDIEGYANGHKLSFDVPQAGIFNDVDALHADWNDYYDSMSFEEHYYDNDNIVRSRPSSWGTTVDWESRLAAGRTYFEWQIPLSAIEASWGDTIGISIEVRDGGYFNAYPDTPPGVSASGRCYELEVEGNFEHVSLPEPGVLVLLGSLATGLFSVAGIRKKK